MCGPPSRGSQWRSNGAGQLNQVLRGLHTPGGVFRVRFLPPSFCTGRSGNARVQGPKAGLPCAHRTSGASLTPSPQCGTSPGLRSTGFVVAGSPALKARAAFRSAHGRAKCSHPPMRGLAGRCAPSRLVLSVGSGLGAACAVPRTWWQRQSRFREGSGCFLPLSDREPDRGPEQLQRCLQRL